MQHQAAQTSQKPVSWQPLFCCGTQWFCSSAVQFKFVDQAKLWFLALKFWNRVMHGVVLFTGNESFLVAFKFNRFISPHNKLSSLEYGKRLLNRKQELKIWWIFLNYRLLTHMRPVAVNWYAILFLWKFLVQDLIHIPSLKRKTENCSTSAVSHNYCHVSKNESHLGLEWRFFRLKTKFFNLQLNKNWLTLPTFFTMTLLCSLLHLTRQSV